MFFLILAGVVSLLGGVLFLFFPKILQKLSSKVNTVINKMNIYIDEEAYKLRIGVGVSLLLIASLLFFVAYYLTRKYVL
jgi:hypothetical protein